MLGALPLPAYPSVRRRVPWPSEAPRSQSAQPTLSSPPPGSMQSPLTFVYGFRRRPGERVLVCCWAARLVRMRHNGALSPFL
jgi:hypothetical protein